MMNTTVSNISSSTGPNSTPPSFHLTQPYRIALIIIYSVVLLVGITGLTLMISLLKANIRSITTIAFLNLMIGHFIFLLTVPFRLYYYGAQTWPLSRGFCKMVSAMIHIHMYIVFTIYTIILTVRFLHYYKKTQRTEFYRRLHALIASAVVWSILILIMLPLVLSEYGKPKDISENDNERKCFQFESAFSESGIVALNMILSIVLVIVSCALTCIQAFILHSMILKYGGACRSQQDFWVQMKNVYFVLIMLICLVPYHLFRLHYLQHPNLNDINEVFLAITALTCFDMLTFTGKGVCQVCGT